MKLQENQRVSKRFYCSGVVSDRKSSAEIYIMEEIRCILCDEISDQVVIEEGGYKGRKCQRCNLIYVSPRPSRTEIQNLYMHDRSHTSAQAHISGAMNKRLYARHNLRIIKKFVKNGSMLEIGAGAGYFLDEGRKKGFEVYGTEFNNVQADFIRTKLRIPCEQSALCSSLFNRKEFDIVYHCDVTSHFYDPITEFININNKLKDKGFLIFETGNLGDMKAKYYSFIETFQLPDHLFFFGENGLKEILKQAGFDLIKIYRYSILSQLLAGKMIQRFISRLRVIRHIKSRRKSPDTSMNNMHGVPPSNVFWFRRLIRNACDYIYYFLRYKVGYVSPKKGRPQTMIIIAQKKVCGNHC